ncbi:hypothetical protein FHR92_001438 [Fontibacillus solani]|uniref:Uncharacterized protein n=1 Tax=Fontibacillus solani TaxID=1572857 RepID=A0A7W3SRL2_9BACL|nr:MULTISPECIES: hypothetical protein [Fontibacillus]MBA9084976.1 hypothetical protein [Fontibacillus solani]
MDCKQRRWLLTCPTIALAGFDPMIYEWYVHDELMINRDAGVSLHPFLFELCWSGRMIQDYLEVEDYQ